MNTRVKRLTALNYFGGKSRHLDWILPLIPTPREYLEPFFGSGAVFLNKKPAAVECISDIEGELINFFIQLREQPDKLMNLLHLTCYSRAEFQLAAEPCADKLERARRFFVRSTQTFGGITHNVRRKNSYRIDVQETRQGTAACVSKFLTKIHNLPLIVERIRMAQIDNRSAFYLIPKFNLPTTFIYQDPPYDHVTRTSNNDYKFELTREEHIKLGMMNNESRSMIMISHYDDPVYDMLYPAPKWLKILGPVRRANLGKSTINRETVWINYPRPLAEDAENR